MAPTLRGMTWNHPRGYDPMIACSVLWREKTDIEITWDQRSLQDFESFPVEELARQYDLIVIDHPHVGQITAEGCLVPLDPASREAERAALADGSVGASYASYAWKGRQWAFPIDAATQVQAYRPDLADGPSATWSEVQKQARRGTVLLPLRAPHTLMSLYTLCGNLGAACDTSGRTPLIDAAIGRRAYDMLADLADKIDPVCFDMDPIAVFERMAEPQSRIAFAPLIYGYVSYARQGFRSHHLAFADIPVAGSHGPIGSALGGTGIAVSARSHHIEAAIDFAYWIAGAEIQRGPYATAGGQPGHAVAWSDPQVNASALNFYERTRETLEGAWLRPRHDGYMPFQQAASDHLRQGLMTQADDRQIIEHINDMFLDSLQKSRQEAT